MVFKNRQDAGRRLAEKLKPYEGKNTVILAIPRGAVPMAEVIAKNLGSSLDVVLVHKIGAPDNPELAVGSVTEFGDVFPNEVAGYYGLSQESLEKYARAEVGHLLKHRLKYDKIFRAPDLKGRVAVIVDDGIATGATMVAAIRSIRKRNPSKIIVATAVAPPETVEKLRHECDEVVVLHTPENMFGVGLFFENFEQVSDREVERILASASGPRGGVGEAV